VLLIACGGRSEDVKVETAGAAGMSAASAGMASGPAGAGGAAASSARGGDGGAAPVCVGATPACIRSCATMGTTQAVCLAGAWQCPGGVFYSDCPADSCTRDDGDCCDSRTGAMSGSACGEDEKRVACDGDAVHVANNAGCIPEGLGVDSCLDLYGLPCDSAELECTSPGSCASSCQCTLGEDGLAWVCVEGWC